MTSDRERDLLEANNRYLEEARIARRAAAGGFQARVDPWLLACFGEAIARDRQERSHRLLEEVLELVQTADCTASEAHQLVDYVFARPVGEMDQEIGGVMNTLAAFCLAHGHDMAEAGERELARVWTKIEKIRAKQAAKPKHSPLPEHVPFPAQADPSGGFTPTHRHRKRGSVYAVLGIGMMQSADWRDPGTPADNCPNGVSVNMREVAIYRGEDGQTWVRPIEEFEDGRFEPLPPQAEPATAGRPSSAAPPEGQPAAAGGAAREAKQ